MNVNYAKFQKEFDSRTISRELPYVSTEIKYSFNHALTLTGNNGEERKRSESLGNRTPVAGL